MYKRILVPLEHSPYDETILAHIRKLARHCGASLVLIHVADGWAARNVNQLHLRESEEMREDRDYLEQIAESLEKDGIQAECVLAAGNPGAEIAEAAVREHCDLIAMSTHGHRFLQDLLYGSVANEVRHISHVPVLLVRAERRSVGSRTPVTTADQSGRSAPARGAS
ncbi:MAG TPA: universal stress protein [Gemmatimonadaceae bacterium]|jgi:nucleotide-binding universal stress UspA family protein